jgi:hypothetical protein
MTDLAKTLSTDQVSTEESTKAFLYIAFKVYGGKFKIDEARTFCNSAIDFITPRKQFF